MIDSLSDEKSNVPAGVPKAGMSYEDNGVSASLYSSFEERFRGAPEEISRRQAVYLPLLEKVRTLQSGAVILDIGCGRGEWLELLVAHGYPAKGVELNAESVLECQTKGLDVVYGEVVEVLRSQPAGSFIAVTSFHMVEHLPFLSLMELLAEIYRVLVPGGVMVLETPNPENILVGACNFYLDPTHRAPIPAELLRFLTEQAGFSSPGIAWVNTDCIGAPLALVPLEIPGSQKLNAVVHLLNRSFFAAPDYAIIAQKAGGQNFIPGTAEFMALCKPRAVDATYFRLLQAETEAKALRAAAQEVAMGLKDADARMHEAKAQISAIQLSYSWKVTAPFRSVGHVLHSISHPYVIPDIGDVMPRNGFPYIFGSAILKGYSSGNMVLDVSLFQQLEDDVRSSRESNPNATSEVLQELEVRLQIARTTLQDAKNGLQTAQVAAQWFEAQVLAIQDTLSWKMAAPIRKIGAFIAMSREPR